MGTIDGVETCDGEARVDLEIFAERLKGGERDTDGEPLTVAVSVPPVPLKAVPLAKYNSPGEDVAGGDALDDCLDVFVGLAVALGLFVPDKLAFSVRETIGDRETLREGLDDADLVPCAPSTREPFTSMSVPGENVGTGDGVAERFDVPVDFVLAVELAVAIFVLLGDGLTAEERDANGDLDTLGVLRDEAESVPLVALKSVPFTLKFSAPADAVGRRGEGETNADLLAFAERETRDDVLPIGELLAAAEFEPPIPFTRLPLKSANAPADAVGTRGDGVAERVDVAVELALPVAVFVAVRVKLDDAEALGEREV